MSVFVVAMDRLPEAMTPAARVLRSSRIFRDEDGNILIYCRSRDEARFLGQPANLETVEQICMQIFHYSSPDDFGLEIIAHA